ncbi:hypothetical protein N7488_002372 [Penicillium malachiteum]|nr:hypothetical protein N7488_002372 [Penicillium malachiteum]
MDGAAGVGSLYRILSHVLALPSISTMLENALSALSCIHFGTAKHDESTLRYGIELYNEPIRHLLKRLNQNLLDVDALYTSVVFQLLETVHCSRGVETWLSHVEGTSKLVQSCYHRLSGNPMQQAIYNHQKLALMYSAATESEEFTCHYSRLLNTPVVGPIDELFALYAGISSLFNQVDNTTFLNDVAAKDLLAACLVQKDKVSNWYLHQGGILGEYPSCCVPETLPYNALPEMDLDTMCGHFLYWTASLLVELLIHRVSSSTMEFCHGQRQNNASMRHIESCLIAEQYADNIVRSLPYCLQTGMNAWRAHVIIACMNHVYKPYALLRRKEKFHWCQKTFQVKSDRGMSLARVVSDAGQSVLDYHEPSTLPGSGDVHLHLENTCIASATSASNELLSSDIQSSNNSARQASSPHPPAGRAENTM